VLRTAALVLAALTVVLTALPLLRARAWWVRVWDFPRVQLAGLGLAALALLAAAGAPTAGGVDAAAALATAAAVVWQGALVWRYTRLAPREVQRARAPDPARTLSLVMSNVLQTNRDADRLGAVLRAAEADVILCVETDAWWAERLDGLAREGGYAHAVRCPLDNTYGMLLYSRLPLEDTSIDFLVQPDIPSMRATVRLRGGARVWLNCVHPRPPAPGESDESLERDAELLHVARRLRGVPLPTVVLGDLNDVAWSRTTRLFQKVSRLLDPRKGRGFYPTFHARWPGFRYPLDHVFHSDDLRLVALRRLAYVGSDHFPVYVMLSHEPPAAAEQEAPAADGEDLREADETLAEAERSPKVAARDLGSGRPPGGPSR
jgi:endonuclease/exonuclease/phosphatase (EEP) superfamily protein YafD